MSECNHDCESCSQSDCGERDTIQKSELNKYSSVKKVIAVMSGKGGVGKSSVTSLMASTMSRLGYKCAILDADITGPSIPKIFGIEGRASGTEEYIYPAKSANNIDIMSANLMLENTSDPVIWRGPLVAGIVKQFWTDVLWKDIDYMFVDMPPGTGDVPLTVFQSLPVDGIIVVTSPQELVSMIVEKAVKMAGMMNLPITGLVENYSYFHCPDNEKDYKIFGESHIDDIAEAYDLEVLAKLPIDPQLAELCDAGKIDEYQTVELNKLAEKIKSL